MFYNKNCVFKAIGRLLFSLFIMNRFSTKNVCSKQVGCCFLVYSLLISNMPKMFYYKFYKASVNRCFLNCCFLVYSSNFIKLLQMAAFYFICKWLLLVYLSNFIRFPLTSIKVVAFCFIH